VLPFRTQEEFVRSLKHCQPNNQHLQKKALKQTQQQQADIQQTEPIQDELTNTKPDTHTTAVYPLFFNSAFLLITVLILYHSFGLLKWG
jgi:hypothetical protein